MIQILQTALFNLSKLSVVLKIKPDLIYTFAKIPDLK